MYLFIYSDLCHCCFVFCFDLFFITFLSFRNSLNKKQKNNPRYIFFSLLFFVSGENINVFAFRENLERFCGYEL